MIRLLSRCVAVCLILTLAVNVAFAWVETLGPKDAEIIKWKESMRGKKATERIVPTVSKVSKVEQNDPELVPLRTQQVYDFDFNVAQGFEAYIDYTRPLYGGFIFEGTDSLGVWFRPATECHILKIQILFHGESGMLGQQVTVNVNDVPDVLPTAVTPQVSINGNGLYGFTEYMECIPSPRGALLGSFPMNVSQVGFNLATGWSEADLTALGGSIDVGKRDFFVSLMFPEGNDDNADVYYGPGEEQHAEGDYHSFKFYHDGGTYSPGTPNWVSRLNFTMRVVVDYYGDPPPFIEDVTELSSVYASCDPGPYEVSAKIYDLGTATFTGAVTKAQLIYFTEDIAVADTIDITTSVVGDIYTGDIPAHAVGTEVFYYFRSEDNGADDTGGEMHWSRTSPKSFQILEANPDATILVVSDGLNDAPEMYTDVLEEGGWICDVWSTGDYGTPTLCALQKYSSLFWLQGQGTGGILAFGPDTTIVPAYLDAGGNIFMVSADYIGIVEDDFSGTWITPAYPFVTDYLKVSEFNSDANPDAAGNSLDSLYMGVTDDVISGFLGTDTLVVEPITFMGGPDLGYNYADEVAPTADATTPFTVYSEGDGDWVEAATMYDGTFKMIFLPWYLEAANDLTQFEQVVKNVLGFFGEKAAPLAVIESGPRYVVAANSGPYAVVATATDGDGTVAGVELGTSSDGVTYTYAAMTLADGEYTASIPALSVDDTLFFKIKATDNDGLNGYAGPWVFNMIDFTPANGLLYCGDDPYDWYYGGSVDSIVIASLGRIGVAYDMYDVDATGYVPPSYIGFLDQYESVIWHGYADWVFSFPEATADNPFYPFVENGGNICFSSEEMVAQSHFDDGSYSPVVGDAALDVLGISWVGYDFNYDTIRVFSTTDPLTVGMDSVMQLTELPFGYMAELFDPVNYGETFNTYLLDCWLPAYGVWYSDWACGISWKETVNGSKKVIVPFPLAALDDANRDAFLTNIITWFGHGVAIDKVQDALPTKFALKQNYPNPFNPVTSIAFEIPAEHDVRLTVYNMLGQRIRTLVNDHRAAGRYAIQWDGKDNSGHMVGSGVYFYNIQAGNFNKTAKMVLLK